jgi:VWFA-related protein
MRRKSFTGLGICGCLFFLQGAGIRDAAQDVPLNIRVNVVLVQLNVAVTDSKGNYVTGLRPEDFAISEDKIPQKVSTFEESKESERGTIERPRREKALPAREQAAQTELAKPFGPGDPAPVLISRVAESNLFILFDTSNYMYRSFVFAQDAIADFIRSMDDATKIAFYSYSRNLSRATPLSSDPYRVISGVRSSVAGDDAALYNSLLLTVKDASPLKGRKAIVVFSNGPDNASSVPPEDVAELAQSTGTVIYIISTRQAQEDPICAAAFERVSRASGGKAYFARNWQQEKQAFSAIREDLVHLYTLSYYPQPNPNRGWRSIKVKLVGKDLQKYRIRTRDGYRLLPGAGRNESETSEAGPISSGSGSN